MRPSEAAPPLRRILSEPFRNRNFRRLLVFLSTWNFATNLAAPFLTVYLLQQLRLDMGTVVMLWAVSQLANAVTVRSWGRISDQLSSTSILAVATPLFFFCLLALPFTALPQPHAFTVPLLSLIHIVMGAVTGGSGLAASNIGLKLAPAGQGTAYLATISLFGSAAAGVAPIIGGILADWFSASEFSLTIRCAGPGAKSELTAIRLQHWEFLFAIAFAVGLYAVHRLSLIDEGERISERVVVQEFVMELRRSMRSLSSISGLRVGTDFPFGRMIENRELQPA
jgi:MFS family permease